MTSIEIDQLIRSEREASLAAISHAQRLEFMLLSLRNLQSCIDAINTSAERENQLGGWTCDWNAAREQVQDEFNELSKSIGDLINQK